MKENFQKSASVTLRQQGLINNNTYINRNGKPVPRPITTVSPSNLTLKESIEKPSNDCEDIYSIKGKKLKIKCFKHKIPTSIPYFFTLCYIVKS